MSLKEYIKLQFTPKMILKNIGFFILSILGISGIFVLYNIVLSIIYTF